MPLVSVILPVYNAAAFLREAIDSIVQQSLEDWELVLVEDCSTDGSRAIIASYTDPRIRPLYLPQNLGVVGAMNAGLAECTGRYVAVMHADDVALPERLALESDWLERHPETALVAAFIDMTDEGGKPVGVWDVDRRFVSAEDIRQGMLTENCIAHSTVMLRRDVLARYGYDPAQQKKGFAVEDYGLWLELLSDGYRFEKIPQPLLRYRVHQQQATTRYLRKSNPFRIKYGTKRIYLDKIRRKRPLNSFDRALRRHMYFDWIMAVLKDVKQNILRR